MSRLIGKIVIDRNGKVVAITNQLDLRLNISIGQRLHQSIHLNDQINLLSLIADLRAGPILRCLNVKIQSVSCSHYLDVILTVNTIKSASDDCFALDLQSVNEVGHDWQTDLDVATARAITNTAHELRAPLNVIIGFADLMLHSQNLSLDHVREYCQSIKHAGHHLLSVVNDILKHPSNLAQAIDCSKLQDRSEEGDAIEVVNAAVALVKPFDESRCFHVDIDLPTGIHFACAALPVRQIIINLISNALKYTMENGKITVGAYLLADDKLRFVVSDNGCGIDSDILAKIGLPFLRANGPANLVEGYGLGLYLVHHLVKKIGAQINFDSTLGVGTRVYVDLPIKADRPCGTDGIVDLNETRDIDFIGLKMKDSLETHGEKGKEKTNQQKTA